MNTIYGYWRCSTDHQDQERQIRALKDAGCEVIVGDKITGTSNYGDREELSKLLDEKDKILKSKMYLRVTLDLPISYEEASFIKETFVNDYDCREITLIPSQQDEEIHTDIDISTFESVDQIVTKEITAIDTENYDKNLLLGIYDEL